jgi:hypothetical protein
MRPAAADALTPTMTPGADRVMLAHAIPLPIASAPRDGTLIRLHCGSEPEPFVGYWSRAFIGWVAYHEQVPGHQRWVPGSHRHRRHAAGCGRRLICAESIGRDGLVTECHPERPNGDGIRGRMTMRPATFAIALAMSVSANADETDSSLRFPKYSHVVVCIMENHSSATILGDNTNAPYINSLASTNAVLSNYFAVSHPSTPNYFALYGGSDFGVTDDDNHNEAGPSLATELQASGLRFTGYIEATSPHKHNPWESFPEGTSVQADFSTWPSAENFASLPAVAFVIPNSIDDMHDGTVLQGDTWLQNKLDSYIQWAELHNSLFILTWDEDDDNVTGNNQVLTILAGANVRPGRYSTQLNHYSTLSTICSIFGVTKPRNAANAVAYPSAMFRIGTPTPAPTPVPPPTSHLP